MVFGTSSVYFANPLVYNEGRQTAARLNKRGVHTMHLKTLLAGLSLRSATADMEMEITRISYDSRTTWP